VIRGLRFAGCECAGNNACHARAGHRKSGSPDLRRLSLQNSGKPEFCGIHLFRKKMDCRVKARQ
jgi:hypothetical protein